MTAWPRIFRIMVNSPFIDAMYGPKVSRNTLVHNAGMQCPNAKCFLIVQAKPCYGICCAFPILVLLKARLLPRHGSV